MHIPWDAVRWCLLIQSYELEWLPIPPGTAVRTAGCLQASHANPGETDAALMTSVPA